MLSGKCVACNDNDFMTPTRPYLVRALHEWILDNDCTPYLLVNADYEGVIVPRDFVNDGKITLNVSPTATSNLNIDNASLFFATRFSGRSVELFIPIGAVLAVYAKENGRGMYFDADEIPPGTHSVEEEALPDDKPDTDAESDSDPDKPKGGKSHLKVIK